MAGIGNQTKELTPKQSRAITVLLTAKDVQSAAQQAGVGERTLHRWLSEDQTFREALIEAENRVIDVTIYRLAGMTGLALDNLEEVLDCKFAPIAPAGVRVRAATVILDQLVRLIQLQNLEGRIAAMESVLNKESR